VVVLVHRTYKPTAAQVERIMAAYQELLNATLGEWALSVARVF
jgi:hypothetical protein